MLQPNRLETVARDVIDFSFQIHQALGHGLLEHAYESLLAAALTKSGIQIRCQVPFKIDLLVENGLVVELKSIERLASVHSKQVLT